LSNKPAVLSCFVYLIAIASSDLGCRHFTLVNCISKTVQATELGFAAALAEGLQICLVCMSYVQELAPVQLHIYSLI